MNKEKFNKKDLEFYLPEAFKGLTKKYILDCMFSESIQSNWTPEIGDIIVGETGNIFVIGGKDSLHNYFGGDLYFFGGTLCTRNDDFVLDETICFTMNESGNWYTYDKKGKIVIKENCYHCAISDFRFVPYPHETERF